MRLPTSLKLPRVPVMRFSTTDQNSDLRIRELEGYAARHGWEVAETYHDMISGASAGRSGLKVAQLRAQGLSMRRIAASWALE